MRCAFGSATYGHRIRHQFHTAEIIGRPSTADTDGSESASVQCSHFWEVFNRVQLPKGRSRLRAANIQCCEIQPMRSRYSDCIPTPHLPERSHSSACDIPMPVSEVRVSAWLHIHSPSGSRQRLTVRSGLINMEAPSKGATDDRPLVKSEKAAAVCQPVGTSPPTTGTRRRIQSIDGPASVKGDIGSTRPVWNRGRLVGEIGDVIYGPVGESKIDLPYPLRTRRCEDP